MATEFEVVGKKYRVGKLDAIKQFHLMRKIGPIVAKIAPDFANQADGLGDMQKMITPVLEALSEMKDGDVDYIIRMCLSVTKRDEGANVWVDCWNVRANMSQFADMDLSVLLPVCLNVIQENLGGFLGGSPSSSSALAGMPGMLNS